MALEICADCGKVFEAGKKAFLCMDCRKKRLSQYAKAKGLNVLGTKAYSEKAAKRRANDG